MTDPTVTTYHPGSGDGPPYPTSPTTPHGEGVGTAGTGCQTDISFVEVSLDDKLHVIPATFSAKTCIELIPHLTAKQLDFEIKHLNFSQPNFSCKSKNHDYQKPQLA